MHEIQSDQRRFADRNSQSQDGVQGPEIDKGDPRRNHGEDEEYREDPVVNFFWDNVLRQRELRVKEGKLGAGKRFLNPAVPTLVFNGPNDGR